MQFSSLFKINCVVDHIMTSILYVVKVRVYEGQGRSKNPPTGSLLKICRRTPNFRVLHDAALSDFNVLTSEVGIYQKILQR